MKKLLSWQKDNLIENLKDEIVELKLKLSSLEMERENLEYKLDILTSLNSGKETRISKIKSSAEYRMALIDFKLTCDKSNCDSCKYKHRTKSCFDMYLDEIIK